MLKYLTYLGYIFSIGLFFCASGQDAQKTLDSLNIAYHEASDAHKAAVLIEAGKLLIKQNLDTARLVLERANGEATNKLDRVASLAHLGRTHVYLGNYQEADSILLVASDLLDVSHYDLETTILNNQGISSFYQGDYDQAGKLFTRFYELAKEEGHLRDKSRGLNNTALVYRYSGQNELALEWLQKSVQLDDSLGLEEPLGDSYNNIALVLVDMKNERLAKEYYFKSLKIKEKYENKRGVFSAYQNIGILYKKIGNYDSALYCFKKGLALAQELSYHKGLIQSNTDLAVVHNILGNRDQAFVHSGRALELALEAQDKDAIAAASLNHGDSHRLRGNYDEARRLIEMGLKASLEVGKMEYTVEAYKMLSQLYEQLQSYKKALEYHKLHKQTSDTLSSTYNSEKMAELQTKYETQKKEQQIAEQDVQINQQLAALQQNRIILIAVSITSVLVLFIVLLLRNRQRRKEQLYLQAVQLEAKGAELNASVSAQEKERARYARDLHDGFGQMISILNINLKNLENDPTRDERQVVFDTSAQVLSDMYDELKNICFDLMPETLIKYGLASALKEFTNRINSLDKIFIELDVFGLESRLSEVLEISLYRICQEWINNILKYSDASKVTIQITTDQKELTLMIEDDGMGFDKAILQDSDGNGWKNLQGRVSIIKGQLELETTPGVKGNSLIVDAPVSYINIDQSTTVST